MTINKVSLRKTALPSTPYKIFSATTTAQLHTITHNYTNAQSQTTTQTHNQQVSIVTEQEEITALKRNLEEVVQDRRSKKEGR